MNHETDSHRIRILTAMGATEINEHTAYWPADSFDLLKSLNCVKGRSDERPGLLHASHPQYDWNFLSAAREKLLVTAPQKRNYVVHLCELIGWNSDHCHTNADVFYLISAPLAAHADALCAALKI